MSGTRFSEQFRSTYSPICALLLLLGSLLPSMALSQSEHERTQPAIYDPYQFFVVFNDDIEGEKTNALLDDLQGKNGARTTSPSMRTYRPARAQTILPSYGLKNDDPDRELATESARQKLSRVLVIEFPRQYSIKEIEDALASDPEIEFSRQVLAVELSHTPTYDETTDGPIIVSKTWGFNEMRAGQAHVFQEGHALVGVADFGVQSDHEELKAYTGNQWEGGNYHPEQAFSIGDSLQAGGSLANPYGFKPGFGAIVGYADEYHLAILNGNPVLDCDTPTAEAVNNWGANGNGFTEVHAAGHGTHVAGIIAANSVAGSSDVVGVCANCPLIVGNFRAATHCNFEIEGVNVGGGTPPGQYPPHYSPSPDDLVEAQAGIGSEASFLGTIGFLIDGGAQVINLSGGIPGASACGNPFPGSDPRCLLIQYALDRDVVWVAAAGNNNAPSVHFPANDSRVIGVGAIDIGGTRWVVAGGVGHSNLEHGSNYGASSATGPDLVAPGSDIYGALYEGKRYNESARCDESTDGNYTNGYGYCTGTSMSTPHISGVAALVRSTNPLASRDDVTALLTQNTNRVSRNAQYGWGVPRADDAVKAMLGTSNGTQVMNRLIPLFSTYSSSGRDIAQTTKPQVVGAYTMNLQWAYRMDNDPNISWVKLLGAGYEIPESSGNYPGQSSKPADLINPRANIFLFSTHNSPVQGHQLKPLYRMRRNKPLANINGDNVDWLLADESEISGSFKSAGYELHGLEGYIFEPCLPLPSCIPAGAEIVYRAWKGGSTDDHVVYAASNQASLTALQYNQNVTILGYAYTNTDSDSDGIIDGMESILGTSSAAVDSDCDGIIDSAEYPLAGAPRSDPNDNTIGSCKFRIEHVDSGKVLHSCSTVDGTTLGTVQPNLAGPCSEWELILSNDDEYVYVQNAVTSMRMRPIGSQNGDLMKISPWSAGGNWTRWKPVPVLGTDHVQLHNKHTQKQLIMYSVQSNPRLQPLSWNGITTRWRIVRVP